MFAASAHPLSLLGFLPISVTPLCKPSTVLVKVLNIRGGHSLLLYLILPQRSPAQPAQPLSRVTCGPFLVSPTSQPAVLPPTMLLSLASLLCYL